jgi:hypothetical protein
VIEKKVLLALALSLLCCASCSRGSDVCESLTSIARDERKMAYARKWIVARLGEQTFRESLRTRHVLGSSDERFQEFGRFDWKFLGFPEGYSELVFIMPITESEEWDATQVYSATLDWGRSYILIKLSSAEGLGFPLTAADAAKTKREADDVYVYCYHGR